MDVGMVGGAQVRIAHTAHLGAAELRAVRGVLDDAFAGDLDDTDFEHALGGMHALVEEGGMLVGHGAVVLRRLLHGGRAIRTGYVEGVAVRWDRRRRGYGAAVMAALEHVVRGGYELGALGSSAEATDVLRGARLAAVDRDCLGADAYRHPAHAGRSRLDLLTAGQRRPDPGAGLGLRLARRRRLVMTATPGEHGDGW